MLRRDNYVRAVTVMFIALELIFFPLIQLLPARGSAAFSYASIVCVFLYALLTLCTGRDKHLIRLGIFFTLCADYFLVLAYDRQLEGVLCFICVQACYFLYLYRVETRACVRRANVVSRILLSFALITVAYIVLGEDTDALAIASVIYYGNLLANIIFAFLRYQEEKIFAIGLVLFAMCDLCIGLDVLFDSYLQLDVAGSLFYSKHHNLPWVFYQPSQLLIGIHLTSNKD